MKGKKNLIKSFADAGSGIFAAFYGERNMLIHLTAAVVALAASFYFQIGPMELLLVITAIFFVFIAEMLNTSVEAVVDLYMKKTHPLARTAKNVAAGAVLLAAIYSLIVAYFVFAERISGLW